MLHNLHQGQQDLIVRLAAAIEMAGNLVDVSAHAVELVHAGVLRLTLRAGTLCTLDQTGNANSHESSSVSLLSEQLVSKSCGLDDSEMNKNRYKSWSLDKWSGRRESNPPHKLGKLR